METRTFLKFLVEVSNNLIKFIKENKPNNKMIDQQRQRVEQEMTKMVDDMDKSFLRKMQVNKNLKGYVINNFFLFNVGTTVFFKFF